MRLLRWIGDNRGGIAAALALATEICGVLWNVHLRQPIDIGAGGLGGGLAAILTASAALLAAPPAARAFLARQQLKLRAMPPMRDEGDNL